MELVICSDDHDGRGPIVWVMKLRTDHCPLCEAKEKSQKLSEYHKALDACERAIVWLKDHQIGKKDTVRRVI